MIAMARGKSENPETALPAPVQTPGQRSDRTIRKWKENNPDLEEMIAAFQVAPMMKHRRDVIDALITVAKLKKPEGHRDRRLFLEVTGGYKPRGALAMAGGAGGAVGRLPGGPP